jgi:hypothetical protein
MKNSTVLLLFLFVAIPLFYSCNSGEKGEQTTKAAGSDSSRATVDYFLAATHQGCVSTIELANIASKSNSLEIRNFADKLILENKILLDSIILIAKSKSITLPDSAGSFAAKTVSKISSADGNEFNKALLRALAVENRRMTSAFRSTRKISDEAIKAFSKNNKGTLRAEAAALAELKKALKEPVDKEEKQRDEKPA